MFCFVIDTPKDDRYQLCSSNGRLNRLYCTKYLEPVPGNVDMGFHLDEAMKKPVTTLHATAKANSTAFFMTIRCKCKKGCDNRCTCVKEGVGCSVYCHGDSEIACANEKVLQDGTECSLATNKKSAGPAKRLCM